MTAKIHWLAFTIKNTYDFIVNLLATNILKTDPKKAGALFWINKRGQLGYANASIGPAGIRILWSPDREDKHIIIPGQACDPLSFADLQALIRQNIKITRIDLAIDGRFGEIGDRLDIHKLYHAIKTDPGHVRTRANIAAKHADGTSKYPRSLEFHDNGLGSTLTLGRRVSQRILRIYNCREDDRAELELRGEKADAARMVLTNLPARKLGETIVGLIRDHSDFIEPNTNKDRATLQPWWRRIVNNARKIKLTVAQPLLHIQRTWEWLLTAGAANIVTAAKAAGGDLDTIFQLLTQQGDKKFGHRHQLLLETAKDWTPQPLQGAT